jgi:hypothetical protein
MNQRGTGRGRTAGVSRKRLPRARQNLAGPQCCWNRPGGGWNRASRSRCMTRGMTRGTSRSSGRSRCRSGRWPRRAWPRAWHRGSTRSRPCPWRRTCGQRRAKSGRKRRTQAKTRRGLFFLLRCAGLLDRRFDGGGGGLRFRDMRHRLGFGLGDDGRWRRRFRVVQAALVRIGGVFIFVAVRFPSVPALACDEDLFQLRGDILIHRAGMCFSGNPELLQFVEDQMRLNFQIPRELVDPSRLIHKKRRFACHLLL